MEAFIASSNRIVPHKGRFHRCDVLRSTVWRVDGKPVVHLQIRRPGMTYVVRLDPEAAAEVAHDMEKAAMRATDPTTEFERAKA